MPADLFQEVSGTWPASPAAVGAARRLVRGWLRDQGLHELEDSCLLVVSELATNAVAHARTPFEVAVTMLSDGLLVRVRDGCDRPPRSYDAPATSAESGRGTFLVEVVSEAWGVLPDGEGGKATWALIASSAATVPG